MTSSPSDAFLRAIRDAAPSDRMAHRLGVRTLYKFRAFRTPRDKERVRDILMNHRVWFAEPSTFEDPHDLRPLLRIRRFQTETEARFALLAAAVQTWDRNRESTPDRLRHRRWLMSASLDRIEARAMERKRHPKTVVV